MSEDEFYQLLKDLKKVPEEIWAAKILLRDLSTKYAPLCIQILIGARKIPELSNNRIEKRKKETGLDPVHPDFWDADMIIAFCEYFENAHSMEVANACS